MALRNAGRPLRLSRAIGDRMTNRRHVLPGAGNRVAGGQQRAHSHQHQRCQQQAGGAIASATLHRNLRNHRSNPERETIRYAFGFRTYHQWWLFLGVKPLRILRSAQPCRARVRAAFFAEADRALFGRPADAAPPSRPPFLAGSLLTENLDAYELNITEDQLRGAPAVVQGWDTGIVSRDWERNIRKYYGVDPYW